MPKLPVKKVRIHSSKKYIDELDDYDVDYFDSKIKDSSSKDQSKLVDKDEIEIIEDSKSDFELSKLVEDDSRKTDFISQKTQVDSSSLVSNSNKDSQKSSWEFSKSDNKPEQDFKNQLVIKETRELKTTTDSTTNKKASVDDELASIFDLKAQEETQNKFTKTVYNDFKNDKTKEGFMIKLWNFLTKGTLATIIAIALVLGLVLFYFDGLQPLILKEYQVNINNQTIKVLEDSNQKTQALLDFQTDNSKIFEGPSFITECEDDLLVDLDSLNLDTLERSMLPNLSLKEVPKVNIFYHQPSLDRYNQYYTEYQDLSNTYIDYVQSIANYATFLDYRNVWINACNQIYSSDVKFETLLSACKDIISSDTKYKNFVDNAILEASKPSLIACQEVVAQETEIEPDANYPGLINWRLEWYAGFSKILRNVIDPVELFKNSESTYNQFLLSTNDLNSDLDKIKEENTQIQNEFYFLDFEI